MATVMGNSSFLFFSFPPARAVAALAMVQILAHPNSLSFSVQNSLSSLSISFHSTTRPKLSFNLIIEETTTLQL